MTWNYRVMRYKDGSLGIHEVYSRDGKVTNWTTDPTSIVGEDIKALRRQLKMMTRALDEAILDYERTKTK